MKKSLFVVALAAVSLNAFGAFGYTTKIVNATDGEITVSIAYGGAGVCNPDTVKVAKGQTRVLEPGLCCARSGIRISGTSGSAVNKSTVYNPPRTGAGLSCKSFSFKVMNTANGGLIAESTK